MEYRRFGKTEEILSVFTLGGMRYPHGWDEPRDVVPDDTFSAALETTKRALDVGINHIETAKAYIKSENIYGKVLPELGVSREEIIITTKSRPAETAGEMRDSIEDSMKRLGVNYLDNFAIHGINSQNEYEMTLKKGGCFDAIKSCMDEGLIRHVGFSTHGPLEVITKTIETDMFEFVNLHFYYFFQRNLPAVELAGSKDMGVFIISPNDKGGQLFNPPKELTELTRPIAPMTFNSRFLLSFPQVTTLSMGAVSPDEIDAHVPTLNNGCYLSEEDEVIRKKLDSQIEIVGDEYCTDCGKCLPCPENINIPEVLRFRNMDVAYGMREFGKYRYNMFQPDDSWFPGQFGDRCTECGDCSERCPEGLDIPRLVKDAHERFYVPKKCTEQHKLNNIQIPIPRKPAP